MGSSKLSSETERIVFLDYLRVFAMFLVFGVHASESVYSDGTLNFLFKNDGFLNLKKKEEVDARVFFLVFF